MTTLDLTIQPSPALPTGVWVVSDQGVHQIADTHEAGYQLHTPAGEPVVSVTATELASDFRFATYDEISSVS